MLVHSQHKYYASVRNKFKCYALMFTRVKFQANDDCVNVNKTGCPSTRNWAEEGEGAANVRNKYRKTQIMKTTVINHITFTWPRTRLRQPHPRLSDISDTTPSTPDRPALRRHLAGSQVRVKHSNFSTTVPY